MADKKISALTASTTPLAGTEVLPIVQSGATVKVAVSDLTAGRAVSAASLALTATPLPVGSGGTGLATVTAGYIPYGAGTGALGTSGNLFWNAATNTLQVSVLGVNTGLQAGYYAAINGNAWFGNTGGVQIGTIENSGGWFDFKGSSNVNGAQISTAISTPVRIVINGAETWRFNASGNLAPAVAGTGIDFSANTHAAGMTSELLNWYEEGTFTATLTPQTSGSITVNPTNNWNTLAYTRIGRVVHVQGGIRISAVSSPSGAVALNLPFTSANLTGDAGISVGIAIAESLGLYNQPLSMYVGEGTATAIIQYMNLGTRTSVPGSDFSGNEELQFNISYIAA